MPSAIEDALKRLEAAVDRAESAIDCRFEAERREAGAEMELQRLGADRSRLANALDAAEARAARLEETNRDVSRRLVAAMETIRDVLERNRT
jgi:chromosome segregation ATPase